MLSSPEIIRLCSLVPQRHSVPVRLVANGHSLLCHSHWRSWCRSACQFSLTCSKLPVVQESFSEDPNTLPGHLLNNSCIMTNMSSPSPKKTSSAGKSFNIQQRTLSVFGLVHQDCHHRERVRHTLSGC